MILFIAHRFFLIYLYMKIPGFRQLCTPSLLYFVISMIFLIVVAFQNYGNVNTYCVGMYECNVASTSLIFAIKIVYVLFWTWILNLMCDAGASAIAWFLVLIPFVLMFLLLSMVMFSNQVM